MLPLGPQAIPGPRAAGSFRASVLWYNTPCMTPRNRTLVLLFGLIGLGFATASAWVHYRIITDPSYSSFCDVSATFNCSQVYMSQYGSFRAFPRPCSVWSGSA